MIFLDTETCLFRPGMKAPPLVCVSLYQHETKQEGLLRWDESEETLFNLLSNQSIAGHYLAYDMMVIGEQFPYLQPLIFKAYEENRIECTEVRQKLIDIAFGVYRKFASVDGKRMKIEYSLADLAYRHLGVKLEKDVWRLRYGELRDTPIAQWPEGARRYAIDDARAVGFVYTSQEEYAAILEDQHRQARADFWLALMSAWGIMTDLDGVKRLADRAQLDFNRLSADLIQSGLLRERKMTRKQAADETFVMPNGKKYIRNTKVAAERIKWAYGCIGKTPPITKGTEAKLKAGRITAEETTVSLDGVACENSCDRLLIEYSDFAKTLRIFSTDIPLLMGGIYTPIHSKFEVLKENGRTGSSKPNIQNPPRTSFKPLPGEKRTPDFRECFMPREGTTFIEADYPQMELQTFSEFCFVVFGYSSLGDALNAGKDPHLMIAEDILSRSYDELKQIHKNGDKTTEDWSTIENTRQLGKVANFGFLGGLGPESLVKFAQKTYHVFLTFEKAQWLRQIWRGRWVETKDYFALINRLVDQPFAKTVQLYSNRHRGRLGYTDCANTHFSGLCSDVGKSAGFRIAKEMYVVPESPLWGCRLVDFVHDNFLGEAPEHRAAEAAERLATIMTEEARMWLPHMKVNVEACVTRRWSKKMKTVRDKSGRLIPWEPERWAA